MKRYEYKVEKVDNLERYLNDKSKEGWRCVGVTTSTGLGWTMTVVLEKLVEEKDG